MKQVALILGDAESIGKELTETQVAKVGDILAGGLNPEGLGKLYKNS